MAIRRPPTTFSDTISTADIADDAITTAKVADDQITGALLANDIAISTTGNIATTGSGTLTVAGNVTLNTPTILVPANKQAVVPVNTVADSDGNTRSPIARDGRTFIYYDYGDAAGTGTWANSGVMTNVASGRRALSGSSYRVSLGSHGARTTTDNLGASYFWTNDNAVTDTRVNPGGDPFAMNAYGLTMGCCFKVMQTNIGGIIFYGDTGTENHFFVRANYSATGRMKLGEDTSGSDNWTILTGSDEHLTARGYWFLCVAQTFSNGDLFVSHNGGGWNKVREGGSIVSPNDAVIGINSDPYNDNSAKNKYLNAFWCEGFLNEALIYHEWQWLQSKWYNASFAE